MEPVLKRLRPYHRILRYFPRYASWLIFGLLCVVGSRLLMVFAPRFLGEALSVLEAGGATAVDRAAEAAWSFLGVSAGAGFFTFGMRRLLVGASRHMERDLKRDLFRHMESLPSSYFDRNRTGDLLSRLTSDIEAVRWSFGPGFMYVGGTLVLFPLVIWQMASISVPITLIALIPLLGIVGVVRLLGPGIMSRTRAVQDRLGDLSARAQESFAGARVVRAYATEELEIEAFSAVNEELVHENIGLAKYRAMMRGGLFALGGAAELVVLWYGGTLVARGEMSLGDLVPLLAYVGLLIWPMISVGWVVSALQRAAAAMRRINEVMDHPPEQATRIPEALPPEPFQGGLELRDLTYAYPGAAAPALEDVSLTVGAGETLALVGPVGAGKSTLLRLIARLYEPPANAVYLDGADVCGIPLATLRDWFAVVPQDAFLFSDTIRANLAYAIEDELDPGKARWALSLAGLDQDVEAFPKGLDTVVGERGLMLSGGQKQRTTLARALLRGAPILLLDDCLSAVDTHTEARILERLQHEMRRRTTIVVAHRLSTVRHADHIVVLDEGKVVERGTHAELVDADGWYAKTYAQQRLEAQLEDLA
ncbi:MAG: ABC transporter ATP-binding protein [Planctomycetota bacterium]|nr:ABC transporter ATP-binding protein [Planctomycetota bacterium]